MTLTFILVFVLFLVILFGGVSSTRIGQCALYVGHQAVQLHGGIGTSDELAVSHYLKRLLMIDLAYGNSDHHLARFAACAVVPPLTHFQ